MWICKQGIYLKSVCIVIFPSSSFKLHVSLCLTCISCMQHIIDSICPFTGGWLLYTIVLVSAIHQPKSATGIHMFPPSWIPLPSPSRLSQSAGLSSCVTRSIPTCYLFYICKCTCFHASLSICPTLSFSHYVHKSVLYIVSELLLCIENHQYHHSRFHMHMLIYSIRLSLTYFTLYNRF